jgi:hypothetical protein
VSATSAVDLATEPEQLADEPEPPRPERGSAVVDVVLIGALTTLLFGSVLQLALALHVRSTVIDCAAEGARYGALADRSPAAGAQRTRDLIAMSLSPGFAEQVAARNTELDGVSVIEVEVTTPLPLLGLVGPTAMTVHGHAWAEQ